MSTSRQKGELVESELRRIGMGKKRVFSWGGIVASAILIVFGIATVVIALNGRSEVRKDIKQEAVVGSPDMTPKAIQAEAQKAGLKNISVPNCSVANQAIDTGKKAHCFAKYMRIHALEATGGLTYAQMPRYATADGKGTNDAAAAVKDPKTGQPQDNGARTVWINETALSTALNTSYFAEQVSLFSIVMGIALLLTGIGFMVLCLRLLMPAEKEEHELAETSPNREKVAVG
jgi:hypothetical protein